MVVISNIHPITMGTFFKDYSAFMFLTIWKFPFLKEHEGFMFLKMKDSHRFDCFRVVCRHTNTVVGLIVLKAVVTVLQAWIYLRDQFVWSLLYTFPAPFCTKEGFMVSKACRPYNQGYISVQSAESVVVYRVWGLYMLLGKYSGLYAVIKLYSYLKKVFSE